MSKYPYHKKEWLEPRFAESGQNIAQMSRNTGVPESTLHKWLLRNEMIDPSLPRVERYPGGNKAPDEGKKQTVGTDRVVTNVTGLTDPLQKFLVAKLRDEHLPKTLLDIANQADASPARVLAAIQALHDAGYSVPTADSIVSGEPVMLYTANNSVFAADNMTYHEYFEGDEYLFAVISDTHLSSKHCAYEELHAAYDYVQAMEISTVLHPGDFTAGLGIFRGQSNGLLHHTFEDQVTELINNYPKRDGIKTKGIAGNHDIEGRFGDVGANPVKALAAKRDDIEYLGAYSAYVQLPNGARIHMLHPMGGGAYAKSYRPQKIIESYDGGDKPNIALIGHYHQALFLPDRNVFGFMAGCFERQNEFGLRKALGQPAVGFWLISVTMAVDGSLPKLWMQWHHFFKGRLHRGPRIG